MFSTLHFNQNIDLKENHKKIYITFITYFHNFSIIIARLFQTYMCNQTSISKKAARMLH